MKKIFVLLLGVLFFQNSFSQDKKDTTVVIVEDGGDFYSSYSEWKDRPPKHWQGFDIGINGLWWDGGTDNPPAGYEYLSIDYSRSFYFGLNLGEVGIPIAGEHLKLVTGLGFDFNNFQLRGNSYMADIGDTLTEVPDTTWKFKNNNMKNSHITVPLLLGFSSTKKHSTSFKLAAGVVFSYRLAGRQKVKYWEGDICNVIVRKSRMHQNPFRAHATIRAGYGNFQLFGTYSLTNYWEDGAAPEARMWVLGLKVIPW